MITFFYIIVLHLIIMLVREGGRERGREGGRREGGREGDGEGREPLIETISIIVLLHYILVCLQLLSKLVNTTSDSTIDLYTECAKK